MNILEEKDQFVCQFSRDDDDGDDEDHIFGSDHFNKPFIFPTIQNGSI